VKALSQQRRHPLAVLALMVLALLLTGGLYAVATTTNEAKAQTESYTAQDIEEGEKLFIANCSTCHGLDGAGTPAGPSLVGVGAAAVDFQVGTGRMPMARPEQQAPSKPVVFTDEEIDALAAYVASLGPGPAIPDESDYSIEGLSEEEREEAISRGGQIFLTNCTACHNFNGAGGAMPRGGYAPSLHGTDPKYIYEALLTGPQQMPNFSNGNLSPEEKRDVIAYLGSLEETPEYAGFTLGGLGPVSEGLFGWIVGIGGLVGAAVWIASHTTRSNKSKVNA
jgi:ubiquinol-cytochrome c reductase cytochrome c subunit